jgi:hypothetical protein
MIACNSSSTEVTDDSSSDDANASDGGLASTSDSGVASTSDGGDTSAAGSTSTLPETGSDGSSSSAAGSESATSDGTTAANDDDGSSGGDASCDPFEQDCPAGMKCSPWDGSGMGGPVWDADHCVDVVDDPAAAGEPCTLVGDDFADAHDTCDVGFVCVDFDQETQTGTCVELCSGTADAPQCSGDMLCAVFNGGALPLCEASCDPLEHTCAPGLGCVLASEDSPFLCVNTPPNTQQGDACAAVNGCSDGQLCVNGALVEGCQSATCCTNFCDLDDPSICDEVGTMLTCAPMFAENFAPPGLEDLGLCVVP